MKIDIESLKVVNKPETTPLRAVVSLRLEDSFIIENIKLIDNKGKLFIAMPSRKTPTGEYKDICFPTIVSLREEMTRVIVDAFKYGRYSHGYSEPLKITDVKIRKIPDSPNGLVAVASIAFNDKFSVHDIKLVERVSEDSLQTRLELYMPSKEVDGSFRNIVYAINDELRTHIFNKIYDEYKRS